MYSLPATQRGSVRAAPLGGRGRPSPTSPWPPRRPGERGARDPRPADTHSMEKKNAPKKKKERSLPLTLPTVIAAITFLTASFLRPLSRERRSSRNSWISPEG